MKKVKITGFSLRKRTIRVVFLMFFILHTAVITTVAQDHKSLATVNHEKQRIWIENTVKQVKQISAPDELPVINPSITDIENYYKISYRLKGNGFIRFDNGDKLMLLSNSSHTNTEVGDLTIAVDKKHNIYINQGHVCGGIINFIVKEKVNIRTAKDFVKLTFCDTDNTGWEKFKR